jgi:hypothetical protein
MRTVILAGAAVLALSATAAKADCLPYEPHQVSISGKLTRVEFSTPSGSPEPYFVLQLPRPICVNGRGAAADEPLISDILLIQLGLTTPQYSQLRPMLGKQVRLTGSLVAATTGHHHTPVMLGVSAIEGVRAGH